MEEEGQKPKRKLLDRISSTIALFLLLALLTVIALGVLNFLESAWVSPWKPILDPQTVASVLVAELPLAYFVKRILGEHTDRPVLEVVELNPRPAGEREPRYYVVTVRNKGEVMAENCDITVTLAGVEYDLCWQPPRADKVNIRPERKQQSEIFRLVPLERNLELPIAKDWSQSRKYGFGSYSGTISIGAENCRPAKRRFRVTFSESKDTIKIVLE